MVSDGGVGVVVEVGVEDEGGSGYLVLVGPGRPGEPVLVGSRRSEVLDSVEVVVLDRATVPGTAEPSTSSVDWPGTALPGTLLWPSEGGTVPPRYEAGLPGSRASSEDETCATVAKAVARISPDAERARYPVRKSFPPVTAGGAISPRAMPAPQEVG